MVKVLVVKGVTLSRDEIEPVVTGIVILTVVLLQVCAGKRC